MVDRGPSLLRGDRDTLDHMIRHLKRWPAMLAAGGILVVANLDLCGCTPAMVASLLGGATAAAPAVASALDAYAATARSLAGPSARPEDVAALAALLAERDRCTVAASSTLMPGATTDADRIVEALRASETAAGKLAAAVDAARVASAKDGGS